MSKSGDINFCLICFSLDNLKIQHSENIRLTLDLLERFEIVSGAEK